MSVGQPDPSRPKPPASDDERRKRQGTERLGAWLFVLTGTAGIIASVRAVAQDGSWANVKLDAADYGLPWWVTLAIALFGVVAGIWVLLSRQ